MIFKRIFVDGFGKLVNREPMEFARGLTVIAGPNESGKSTLAECIVRLLYGYPKQPFNEDLDRFRPWQTGVPFRARLEYILDDGRGFETSRDFAGEVETVTRTLDTKERVDVWSGGRKASPGQAVLNLSLDAYRAAAVIRAGELQSGDDADFKALGERLAAVVGSAGDEGADAAIAALRNFATKDVGSPQSTTTPFAIARREREAAEREVESASAAFHALRVTIEKRAAAMAEVEQLKASCVKSEFAVKATRLRALVERARAVDFAQAGLEEAISARKSVGGGRVQSAESSEAQSIAAIERAINARDIAHAEASSASGRAGSREPERSALRAQCDDCKRLIAADEQRDAKLRAQLGAAVATAGAVPALDRAAIERLETQDVELDAVEARARSLETRAAIARQLRPASAMWFAPVLLVAVVVLVTGWSEHAQTLIYVGAIAAFAGMFMLLRYLAAAGKRAERIRAAEADSEEASNDLDRAREDLADACLAFGCSDVASARARFGAQRDRDAVASEATALAATLESRRAQLRSLEAQLAGIGALERDVVAGRASVEAATAALVALLDAAGIPASADVDARIAAFREMRGAVESGARADTVVAEAQTSLTKALGSFDVDTLRAEIARLTAELRDASVTAPALAAAVDEAAALAGWNDLRRRLVDAELRLAELTAVYEAAHLPDNAALEERAEACRAEERRLAAAARAALIARDVIDEVKIQVHKSFLPTMNSALGEALDAITAGKYVEAHLNPADFAVRLTSEEKGGTVDPGQLSSGTLEQVNLALRAATAQALGSGESVPLILDDALAHADADRAAGALKLLANAGVHGVQAIFFTQRPDLVILARGLPGVAVIDFGVSESEAVGSGRTSG